MNHNHIFEIKKVVPRLHGMVEVTERIGITGTVVADSDCVGSSIRVVALVDEQLSVKKISVDSVAIGVSERAPEFQSQTTERK